MKILVVDDNEAIYSGLCKLLERERDHHLWTSLNEAAHAVFRM